MREVTTLIAFILLATGTIGLLVNEYVLDWGRVTTLAFAAVNILGLVFLAFSYWGMKKE